MKKHLSFSLVAAVALVALNPSTARAVPSYARQTGLSCNGCHTTPPELNSAGRRFKLIGYTDKAQDTPTITNDAGIRHSALDQLRTLPLSAMFETSFTSVNAKQPGTQNGSFQLPQDVSLFLSGAWSTHVGSFVQLTYHGQSDHFSWDNTDIRAASKGELAGKELVYGLTLNNNPTIEDLWNSTPAWGYPFIATDAAPSPGATPLIQGLGQSVAGLGGYGMWNDHLYVAGTIYRSNNVGSPKPTPGTGLDINIQGVAPYWRVAWQQSIGAANYLEVGAYGMNLKTTPNAVAGLKDSYRDSAVDFQYDRTMFVRDVFSLRGTYIRQRSSMAATFDHGGAGQRDHHLSSFMANGEYHLGNRYSAALGVVSVNGTADTLLYAPAPVTGFSESGSPKTVAYIGNLSYWPMQNLQLAIQHTAYTRFNGASTNYDGAGRNARQNNTTYLLARFLF